MTVIWTIVIGSGCAGLGYLIRMMQDGWNAVNDTIARRPRCDWCDGFTMDRHRCICTVACTFVPQCGWEANRDRAPRH